MITRFHPLCFRYSYTLVLVFFFLALGLDTVWAPLELVHLLSFHLTGVHVTRDLGVASFALYVFLLGGLAIVLAAFCVENVLRLNGTFSGGVKQAWPLAVVFAALFIALILSITIVGASVSADSDWMVESYLVLDQTASEARITVLTILILVVVAAATLLVASGVMAIRNGTVVIKSSESFMSAQSPTGSSNLHPQLPHFPLNQDSGPGCSSDDQVSVSPISCKMPEIMEPEEKDKCGDLTRNGSTHSTMSSKNKPGALPVKGPSMLAVNMAQVTILGILLFSPSAIHKIISCSDFPYQNPRLCVSK